MDLVAITRLASSIDAEAKALAQDLGGLAYDQRLKLARGIPAIVLSTPDPARARDLAANLVARGHAALHFTSADVVDTEAMVQLRRFAIEPDALVAPEAAARLPWGDIAVLVRAAHRTTTQSSEVVHTSKFSPARAIITGGMIMKKVTSKQQTTYGETTEEVLYVFPRTGGKPWLLREQHASYATLGDLATAASMHNFETTVDRLRTLARGAVFDDRLTARKTGSSEVDLLAHVVASSVLATTASPFR